MKPIVIEFSEAEVAKFHELALRDCEAKNQAGVRDRILDRNRTSPQVKLEGILGEAAAHRLFKHPYIFRPKVTGDDGFDIRFHDGKRAEIKTPSNRATHFALAEHRKREDFKTDYGIACRTGIRIGMVEIWGWLTREEFRSWAIPKVFQHGEQLAVPFFLLRPMSAMLRAYPPGVPDPEPEPLRLLPFRDTSVRSGGVA